MADEAPQEEPTPEQTQQQRYVEAVVDKLKTRLGDRDVEIAQLQTRLELVMAERNYFLQGLRDNGLIQESPQPQVEEAEAEAIPASEVEVLPPPS